MAFLVDFEGPVLAKLPEDTAVRSQVSIGDNAELVENNLRYNPEIKGWRLTLRMKVKDPSKSVEMRAALLRDVPVEPAKPAKPAKQDKAAAKAAKAEKPAEQPAADAASTTGAPATTEQVLTETWSYQLPADE
ncbi:Glucans biosynthesis protein G precursor [compost metagenome]